MASRARLPSQPTPSEASSSRLSACEYPHFACERARSIASWRAAAGGFSFFAELPFRIIRDGAQRPGIGRAVGVGAKGLSARGCRADIVEPPGFAAQRRQQTKARRNPIIIFSYNLVDEDSA